MKYNHESPRMDTNKIELLCRSEVYAIVGAAMEVYNQLGAGFSEAIYQEVMEIEFGLRGIPYERQKRMSVVYKGRSLKCEYVADLVCFGSVIVEIKSLRQTTRREEGQLINYLRITGLRVGLLINFGDPGQLDWERFVV
jgi:GxxExxY protein